MKDLKLLAWLTQLGLSVAAPLVGFPLLSLWLQNRFGWGNWVFWVALGLGILTGAEGFLTSLKALDRLSRKQDDPSSPSYSDHH